MRLILCLLATILVIGGAVMVSAQSCECAKPLYSVYLNQAPSLPASKFIGYVLGGKDLKLDIDKNSATLALTGLTKIVDGIDEGGGIELISPAIVTFSLGNIPKLTILEYWPESKEYFSTTYERKDGHYDNKLEITATRYKLPAK